MLMKLKEEAIDLERFVAKIKEAVKGEHAAKKIQEAVALFLKNYGIEYRVKNS